VLSLHPLPLYFLLDLIFQKPLPAANCVRNAASSAERVSARLPPGCSRQQSLQRAIVQAHRIAFAFHCQAQHRAGKFIRANRGIADGLERQPCFVKGRFQNDKRLRIE
jgi:hypothetical protein